jgi:hypothetical protein
VGDAVGWRFGVIVAVYPLSVGVGVAVDSAAPGVGEAALTASCCATGELVGVGLASGVALVRSGASDASSSPAPDSPVSGMRAVSAEDAGSAGVEALVTLGPENWAAETAGDDGVEACVPIAAAAAGVTTTAGASTSSSAGRVRRARRRWGWAGCCRAMRTTSPFRMNSRGVLVGRGLATTALSVRGFVKLL